MLCCGGFLKVQFDLTEFTEFCSLPHHFNFVFDYVDINPLTFISTYVTNRLCYTLPYPTLL